MPAKLLPGVLFVLFSSAVALPALAASKALICHKGQEIEVSTRSLPAHFDHGDSEGPCPPPSKEVVILRCLADASDTPISVSSLSQTEDTPEILASAVYGEGESCAEAIAKLLNAGYRRGESFGDDSGGLQTYHLFIGPPVDGNGD